MDVQVVFGFLLLTYNRQPDIAMLCLVSTSKSLWASVQTLYFKRILHINNVNLVTKLCVKCPNGYLVSPLVVYR